MLGLIIHRWPELEGIVDAQRKQQDILSEYERSQDKQQRQLFIVGYLTHSRNNIIFNIHEEFVAVSTGERITSTGFHKPIPLEE